MCKMNLNCNYYGVYCIQKVCGGPGVRGRMTHRLMLMDYWSFLISTKLKLLPLSPSLSQSRANTPRVGLHWESKKIVNFRVRQIRDRRIPRWLSKEYACQSRRRRRCVSSIPGLGRSPGEDDGNPLQYPCRGNLRTEGPGGWQSLGSQGWTQLSIHAQIWE